MEFDGVTGVTGVTVVAGATRDWAEAAAALPVLPRSGVPTVENDALSRMKPFGENPWELSPWYERLSAIPDLAHEVAECVAEGELPRDIARRLGVKRGHLSLWLRSDPERYALYCAGLQAAADEKVMEGFGIVDGEGGNGLEPEQVPGAKLRVDFRKWVAGKWDRGRFGESDKNVNVGVGLKVVLSRGEENGL